MFDVPQNFAFNYGQRVRGWFQTTFSGNYTFFSSCDDFCDFYLSEDIYPAKKSRIISQTQSTYNTWNMYCFCTFLIGLKNNKKLVIILLFLIENFHYGNVLLLF